MPGTLTVRVREARNLPVMDRANDTTDAYVEIHFGDSISKTEVFPKSLCPRWDTDWFVFEAEEHELQDECLMFRVMDYDTYSANDPIGRVFIDLNPLIDASYNTNTDSTTTSKMLIHQSSVIEQPKARPGDDGGMSARTSGSVGTGRAGAHTRSARMYGWLPIIDTLHGHRGDLLVDVKLEIVDDVNQMRRSSCGVMFCVGSQPPSSHQLCVVHGMVDDIVTNGDPEYLWLDKIRAPRTTNDARQSLMRHLAGEMRRRIGVKVMQMGANAVLGIVLFSQQGMQIRFCSYHLKYDLEGESTGFVCVRATGTAVSMQAISKVDLIATRIDALNKSCSRTPHSHSRERESSAVNSIQPLKSDAVHNSQATPPATTTTTENRSHSNSRSRSGSTSTDGIVINVNQPTTGAAGDSQSKITKPRCPVGASAQSGQQPQQHGDIVPPMPPSIVSQPRCRRTSVVTNMLSAGVPLEQVLDMQKYHDLTSAGRHGLASDVPLLTIDCLPGRLIQAHGGVVCARAVKLLTDVDDKENTNKKQLHQDAAETRAEWWNELRSEILSHMKSLSCNVVLAYTEEIAIDDEVCIMSAMGTAVSTVSDCPLIYVTEMSDEQSLTIDSSCLACHLPYSDLPLPFTAPLQPCVVCGEGQVGEVLLSSCALSHFGASVCPSSVTPMQTVVVRSLRSTEDEVEEATEISQLLPFLEHQVHNKLMSEFFAGTDVTASTPKPNAIVALRIVFIIAQNSVAGVLTGLAVRLLPLAQAPDQRNVVIPVDDVSYQTPNAPLTTDKNAICVLLTPTSDANADSPDRTITQTPDTLNELTNPNSSHRPNRVSSLISAVKGLINTPNDASIADVQCTKLQLFCWPYMPSPPAAAGVGEAGTELNDSLTTTTDSLGVSLNASMTNTNLETRQKRTESRLDRIKFRRRRHVDKQDFETSLLVRDLALTIGFLPVVCPVVVPSGRESSPASATSDTSQTNDTVPARCGIVTNTDQFVMEKSRTSTCALTQFADWLQRTLTDIDSTEILISSLDHNNQLCDAISIASTDTTNKRPLICRYVGCYDSTFIRETSALKDVPSIECFVQGVLDEIICSIQCHVRSYGANALLALRITGSELFGSAAKTKAQCLIGVTGDMVLMDNAVLDE